MQRFKSGDVVLILPEFAGVYPAPSAVVLAARPNPFRSVFDEYTVLFADSSTAKVFQFQIIENLPNHTTVIADLVFDTRKQRGPATVRSRRSAEHIVLQTGGFDLYINLSPHSAAARSLLGQVVEREASAFLQRVDVRLMKKSTTIATTQTDDNGEFEFRDVPIGTLNILFTLSERRQRILGVFST